MTSAAHPIDTAWVSAGGTGAKNYDEFPDESVITDIISDNPTSMLAVEMPDRAPEAVAAGLDFEAALPAAQERLTSLQQSGRFTRRGGAVVVYRITSTNESPFYGLFCMVDSDEISTSADEPGRVIRNEDVFIEKVRQRAALNQRLRHLLSPVLLVQNRQSRQLHEALAAACVGEPAVSDTDEAGRQHEVWPIVAGDAAEELCALAGGGELIVADGNHRSLAAQVGELPRFLAVVTTAESVTIQPYHRLVADLPLPAPQVLDALRQRGAEVTKSTQPLDTPAVAGTIQLYADGVPYLVRLPDVDGTVVERLDHARVETVVFNDVLGMDAGDKRITYVGGDYSPQWLADQVDARHAQLAILIAPVTVDDFLEVNLARLKLPRKSTWFVPKARAGLVLSDLR